MCPFDADPPLLPFNGDAPGSNYFALPVGAYGVLFAQLELIIDSLSSHSASSYIPLVGSENINRRGSLFTDFNNTFDVTVTAQVDSSITG